MRCSIKGYPSDYPHFRGGPFETNLTNRPTRYFMARSNSPLLEIEFSSKRRCRRCFSSGSNKKARAHCLSGLKITPHLDDSGHVNKKHWKAYLRLFEGLQPESPPKNRSGYLAKNGYLWEHPAWRCKNATPDTPNPGFPNYKKTSENTDGKYTSLSRESGSPFGKWWGGMKPPKSIPTKPQLFGTGWYDFLRKMRNKEQLFDSFTVKSPSGDSNTYGEYKKYRSSGLVIRNKIELDEFWENRLSLDIPGIYISLTDKELSYDIRKYGKKIWGSYCGESHQLPNRVASYNKEITIDPSDPYSGIWISNRDGRANIILISDFRPNALSVFSEKNVRVCLEAMAFRWLELCSNRLGKWYIGTVRNPPEISSMSLQTIATARAIFGNAVEPLLQHWIEKTLGVTIPNVVFVQPLH